MKDEEFYSTIKIVVTLLFVKKKIERVSLGTQKISSKSGRNAAGS